MIIITKGEEIEGYSCLTDICECHKLDKFKYSYLKSKKFPFVYKKWLFRKINPVKGKRKK